MRRHRPYLSGINKLKHFDLYNDLIETIARDTSFIGLGESVNNGSFIGGLARQADKLGMQLINLPNNEYSHVGCLYGLSLSGINSMLFVKQLDFLLLAVDQLHFTNEILKTQKQAGKFLILAVIQDQGMQGPHSSFNRISDFLRLVNFPSYYLNAPRLPAKFRLPGFPDHSSTIIVASQRLLQSELVLGGYYVDSLKDAITVSDAKNSEKSELNILIDGFCYDIVLDKLRQQEKKSFRLIIPSGSDFDRREFIDKYRINFIVNDVMTDEYNLVDQSRIKVLQTKNASASSIFSLNEMYSMLNFDQ